MVRQILVLSTKTEFQSSDFDFSSTQAVKNVMQEVLLFSELSSREQLSHIEMEPPAEITDSSFFTMEFNFRYRLGIFRQLELTKLICQRRLHHLRRHQHRQ